MSWTKLELLAIIKKCKRYGVSELACGELLIRFSSPPAETKSHIKENKKPISSTIPQIATDSPQTDYTLEDEDRGLNQDMTILDDPSAYLEKLERGDVELAKPDGDGVRA
jgi:hypothetical protein